MTKSVSESCCQVQGHCKDSRRYKKKWGGGALAGQEMGSWWSINSSIMSPVINFKCSQKQPKLQCAAKYKEIASWTCKSSRNYKNFGWGVITGSRDGAQLCIQKLISSDPETTKNKKFLRGLRAPPNLQLLIPVRCARLFSTVSIVFFPADFKSARYHSRFCIFN